jgi:NADPH-dependent 2,4-dienoyl-CoA reductase/sulfur reductase-like enzyme
MYFATKETNERRWAVTASPSSVLIVGAGLAGAKTAEALRERGYQGQVTLIGAEGHLPYERPPLSKGMLLGKSAFDEAVVHPEDWYRDNHVELRPGTEVVAVHPEAAEIELAGGERLGYGKLVLATGSEPRRLPLPGADARNVFTLRTREDSDAIRATFGAGRRLVIIGGGWIGLEVAAAAREADTAVAVLEAAELPLLAVLGHEMATVFADLHRGHGVDLRLGAHVSAISSEGGTATGVRLADGEQLPADAVVIGVGAAPRLDLAVSAGLDINTGVLVDESLRTSNPDIYAVGDIAEQDHKVLGRRVRVEHWANALNQPATAAAAILGDAAGYDRLPYFFTDQYDLGMEYVGFAAVGEYARVVVRGELDNREFVAFWLSADDTVLAAMNVNVWDIGDEVKPLIAGRVRIDVDKLASTDVPLSEVAAG